MIQRALLSVSDKTGLIEFARFLADRKVMLLSTGGTALALRDAGLPVTEVAEYTGFPEMLDGRVKTLHPRIHGGLLGKRDDPAHVAAMQAHGIEGIDLVVINLYPFEATVARGAGFEECVENIDIGGPAMIRSAAKNHAHVGVVTDPADYDAIRQEIEKSGLLSAGTKQYLAAKAFARTAAYDSAISQWFARERGELFPMVLTVTGRRVQPLHYGENPHQQAAFYGMAEAGASLASAQLAHGERLSYNNLNDASAALELVAEFSEPAVVIVKHANPCGVAVAASIEDAYGRALACDPVSAYGGIIALNRPITRAFVEGLGKIFLEVLIAPSATADALDALKTRKKLRLLLTGTVPDAKRSRMTLRSVAGGFLYQQDDAQVLDESTLKAITKTHATPAQLNDMKLAFTVAKHVKSNAIVLVRDGATIGIGAGQMSRIDSTRIACWKAKEAGLDIKGAVLASDAFFPFADNVVMAAEAGISAVIQPGGSIRDEEVIQEADARGISMVFTGIRHFRH